MACDTMSEKSRCGGKSMFYASLETGKRAIFVTEKVNRLRQYVIAKVVSVGLVMSMSRKNANSRRLRKHMIN